MEIINLKWDTTKNINEYPNEIKKKYKTIYFNNRKKFSNWIGKISKQYSNDIDWWASTPASRNMYYSNLYKYLCILDTIDIFLKKKKIILHLVIDSKELKKIINLKYENKVNIDVINNKHQKNKFFFLIHYFNVSIFFLLQFLIIKFFLKSKFPFKINNYLTLIDTFIIDINYKHRHYYGNLEKYFDKKNNKTFFIPTFATNNFFNFIKFFKNTRNQKNYIFKENFTRISDIVFCIFYIFRKKKFKKFLNYKDFNICSLIKEELKYNRDILSIFLSLYNFRFTQRLSLNSIRIKKVVNWFENQSLDKGWNFGFRKFYPKIKTIGYQGFTLQPENMNTIPTFYEMKYKVIPDQIVTVGKNFIYPNKEFCQSLNVVSGPALRFNDLFNFTKKLKKKFKIAIFLEGASMKNDQKLILNFIKISKNFAKLKFYIKEHPSLILKKEDLKLPNNFTLLKNKFSFIAKRTLVAVAYGNTSATLESLAYGCKLLLPIDNFFDQINLKKLKIPTNLYRVCSNQNDILDSIRFFLKKNNKLNYNKFVIKNELFNKVTSKNVKILI